MSAAPSYSEQAGADTGSDARSALRLAPRPDAAGRARHWLAQALDGWSGAALETAQLLLSEVVTNAVLHARTEVEIRLALSEARARLEVADGVADGPLPKHFEPDAGTGRGLKLVARLALEWGVRRSSQGKVVWFTVAPSSGAERAGVAAAPLMVDLEDWTLEGSALPPAACRRSAPPAGDPSADPAAGTGGRGESQAVDGGVGDGPEGLVEVRILGVPVPVYLEAEQYNDAVVRELGMIAASADAGLGEHEVPGRLLELAGELWAEFAWATDTRAQVERSIERGEAMVDLVMTVPVARSEELLKLADQLDEVDHWCDEGELLTVAASPLVRRFRRWTVQQIAGQLAGQPARSWADDHP